MKNNKPHIALRPTPYAMHGFHTVAVRNSYKRRAEFHFTYFRHVQVACNDSRVQSYVFTHYSLLSYLLKFKSTSQTRDALIQTCAELRTLRICNVGNGV